jgi:SAM-dependent methyltransferase
MPTLQPHEAREIAENFGADAERYDRTRPSYPAAMVAAIVGTSPGTDVLDVGIGTGIAARQFRAAGCQVLGVEPDARMAAWARAQGLAVEVATIEGWEPAGRSFDAVVAGQTWHWVDPDAGAAKAARVLRPGGRLALFWNAHQPPAELGAAFAEVYRQVLPDFPVDQAAAPGADPYGAMAATAEAGIRAAGAFAEPERWRFGWARNYTRDSWLDQVPTHGGVNRLPARRREALLDGLGAAIDAAGGGFTMAYSTVVVTATRTPA